MNQARTASYEPIIAQGEDGCVRVDYKIPTAKLEASAFELPAWESDNHVKEEEFARAEALGLFDYLHKSRSGGFVLSLSGGADSAAVATLIAERPVADDGDRT